MKTLRCAQLPMYVCIRLQTNTHTHTHTRTTTFQNPIKPGCGISALHAKWLWVSARHPQCETADNKIMAMSGAFVVRPDDSILLARRKRPNVSSTVWWLVSFDPRREQCWKAFFHAPVMCEWFVCLYICAWMTRLVCVCVCVCVPENMWLQQV